MFTSLFAFFPSCALLNVRKLQLKMNSEDDVLVHFTKFDQIINELRCSGAQAVNDEQFLCCILLKSMNKEFKQAVTAIAMTSKDDLKIEIVKSNLRTYSLGFEEKEDKNKTNNETAMFVDNEYNSRSSFQNNFRSARGGRFRRFRGNHREYHRGNYRDHRGSYNRVY